MGKQVEEQLGKRVAGFREVAGLTQAQLAERVHVATETISRLERGATIPSVSRLDDIARALGVGIHDLFEPEPAASARNEALAGFITELKRQGAPEIELLRGIARLVFAHRVSPPGHEASNG